MIVEHESDRLHHTQSTHSPPPSTSLQPLHSAPHRKSKRAPTWNGINNIQSRPSAGQGYGPTVPISKHDEIHVRHRPLADANLVLPCFVCFMPLACSCCSSAQGPGCDAGSIETSRSGESMMKSRSTTRGAISTRRSNRSITPSPNDHGSIHSTMISKVMQA